MIETSSMKHWMHYYNEGKLTTRYGIPMQDITDKHLLSLEKIHRGYPKTIFYIIVEMELEKRKK